MASRVSSDGAAAVRYVVWTGVLLGIGAIGAIDEIVFHQLLQWHNFIVQADQYWRIVSDGLFHGFTLALLVLGALRLWTQRRRVSTVVSSRSFWSGVLMGAGGFQLFDGIVNHKILQLHPVREGVGNLWAYDLAWNVPAALVLLAGWLLWRSLPAEEAVAPAATGEAERPDRAA